MDVTDQNFLAATSYSITGYSITGRIATSSGVDVQLDNGPIVQTNSAGCFTFSGVANGQHTLTTSKNGYSFVPVQKTVEVNNSSQSGQNFIGTGP